MTERMMQIAANPSNDWIADHVKRLEDKRDEKRDERKLAKAKIKAEKEALYKELESNEEG